MSCSKSLPSSLVHLPVRSAALALDYASLEDMNEQDKFGLYDSPAVSDISIKSLFIFK